MTEQTDPRQENQEQVQAERGPTPVRASSPNPNMVKALMEERQAIERRPDLDPDAKSSRLAEIDKSLTFYGHRDGDAPETDAEALARKQAPNIAGAPADDGGEHARRAMVQGLLEERHSLTVRTDLDDNAKKDRISQVDASLKHYGHNDKAEAAEQRGAAAESEEGTDARTAPPKSAEPAQTSGQTTRSTKK